MPRLAIAKNFLGEYAKLEKSVQISVESAIGKFEPHTHAGLHLEKIHNSRDDRIRTIRVDAFWRGVVLAPDSGDTYCLITVMPHDKANAYATSHRFTVNQALGVLEVRNEAALEQMQPSLATVAQKRQMTGFSLMSTTPTSPAWASTSTSCPLVRLLSSEAHLEALQTVLPEAQYTALYALACGMTAEEAWREVAQYLPRRGIARTRRLQRSGGCHGTHPGPGCLRIRPRGTPAHPGSPVRGLAHLSLSRPAQIAYAPGTRARLR